MLFRCTKSCFIYRVTQKISHKLLVMLRNDWKCIYYCVLLFVFIILNFNAFCHMYTVQRVYTVFLKRNSNITNNFWKFLLNFFQQSSRRFMAFLKSPMDLRRNIMLNYITQTLQKFKCLAILCMLESVHNLWEVHDLYFLMNLYLKIFQVFPCILLQWSNLDQ